MTYTPLDGMYDNMDVKIFKYTRETPRAYNHIFLSLFYIQIKQTFTNLLYIFICKKVGTVYHIKDNNYNLNYIK